MTYIVATPKAWFRNLAQELSVNTGLEFHLIDNPKQLTPEALTALEPRYIFFPHWNHMIPPSVYEHFECVIFHMTDVPFGRGGSPMQNLIARGIYDTKISALRAVKEVDAGPVYLKRDFSLREGSARQLFEKMTPVIRDMILEIVRTEPEPVPQSGEPVVFRRRKPEDGNLVGAETLRQVYDYIRMLDAQGYPPAFADVGPYRLEFDDASFNNGEVVAKVTFKRRTNE